MPEFEQRRARLKFLCQEMIRRILSAERDTEFGNVYPLFEESASLAKSLGFAEAPARADNHTPDTIPAEIRKHAGSEQPALTVTYSFFDPFGGGSATFGIGQLKTLQKSPHGETFTDLWGNQSKAESRAKAIEYLQSWLRAIDGLVLAPTTIVKVPVSLANKERIVYTTTPDFFADKSLPAIKEQADVPSLDTTSGEWVTNKLAAKLEGIKTRTLADYRQDGATDPSGNFGIDKDGRKWRRIGTRNSHPWYLKSSLISQQSKS